jgi:hypothetical protein
MKVQSEFKISRRMLPATFAAVGILAAASVYAEPVNEAGVTPASLLQSPPQCGDIRGRVAMFQLENGATYVLAEKSRPLLQRAGDADSWEADHMNSGN